MVKFLIGLATGVLLTFVTILLLFLVAVRFREKAPLIASNSVLVMHLDGAIPEKPPLEIPFLPTDRPSFTMANIWMALRNAAVDPHIKAVVLEPEQIAVGWAKLEEIRAGIEQFRKSGKPVYAYLRTPTTRDYYLASAAGRVYLGPQDQFYVKGLRAEMLYFKNTLDKLGVTMEMEHAGKYKDFGDMFTRSNMSAETKEVMNSVLDVLYGNIVAAMARGRNKTPAEVRDIIDRGPFLARQAKDAGLVDALAFEDQMWGQLAESIGVKSPVRVPIAKYARVPAEDAKLSGGKTHIALVVGEGDILRGSASDDGSGDNLTSYGFVKLLRRVASDSLIKAVVVRIDSPGGVATASDEIWREMNLLGKKKPLVISMSDAAASGGYYISMTGDPVVAYSATVTGSIGVVFGKPNLHGLYDKLGVSKDILQRGRWADIDSEYKPLAPAERAKLREGIDDNYRDFVGKVAEGRRRQFADIEPLAQGRVWMGAQAKERGLVDEIGGFDRALELVRQKAKIPDGQAVDIVVYPPRRTWIEALTQRSQENLLEAKLGAILGHGGLRAWLAGGMLRLSPYAIEFK